MKTLLSISLLLLASCRPAPVPQPAPAAAPLIALPKGTPHTYSLTGQIIEFPSGTVISYGTNYLTPANNPAPIP